MEEKCRPLIREKINKFFVKDLQVKLVTALLSSLRQHTRKFYTFKISHCIQ